MSILQRLYDSEISFEVSGFYDAAFDVRLGDHLNGFLVKDKVETWAEAETWLRGAGASPFPGQQICSGRIASSASPLGDSPRTVSRLYGIGPTRLIFLRATRNGV